LSVHHSGTVLQGENSRDFIDDADPALSDQELPHDELNVIVKGKNYGWPYCYDNRRNSPEFRAFPCADTVAPVRLLPAHSAPLGMVYWGDRLIVGYHGYRDTGHRLVSFPIDARGVPNGPSIELIGDWAEKDAQLAGGPVGVAPAPDGSLWLTDDRNNVVLRLSPV
jgi:glucose/arabinose dehydrogenase